MSPPSPLLHLPALRAAARLRSAFTGARLRSGAPAATLVLDLDETVLFRTRGLLDAFLLHVVPASAPRVGLPYAHAAAAIRRLARRFRVVAVTARWRSATASTQGWLAAHGLGGMPVVLAADMHPRDASRVAYKRAAIRLLRDEGWAPVLGVGDRPSDLAAYVEEGLRCVMVAHAQGAAPGSAALALHELAEAELLLRAPGAAAAAARRRVVFVSDDPAVHEASEASPSLGPGPHLLDGRERDSVWAQIERFIEAEADSLGAGDAAAHEAAEAFVTLAPLDGTLPAGSGAMPLEAQRRESLA